jgi:hypothetical protein
MALLLAPAPCLARTVPECLELKKVFTSYDALRQANSFDLHLRFHSSRCVLPTLRHADPNPPEVRIQVRPSPGLGLELAGFSYGSFERLNPGRLPPLEGAHELSLIFRITASAEVSPGEHTLPALLNYETLDRNGVRKSQKLAMLIPVKIVAQDAQVQKQTEEQKWNPLQVLLAPARLLVEIGKIISGPDLTGW